MTEVQAETDGAQIHIIFDHTHQPTGCEETVGADLDSDPYRAGLFSRGEHRLQAPSHGLRFGSAAAAAGATDGRSEIQHDDVRSDLTAGRDRARDTRDRVLTTTPVGGGQRRTDGWSDPDGVDRESGVGQPVLERQGGLPAGRVEVTRDGVYLDCVEPESGDVDEVLVTQRSFAKRKRRQGEPHPGASQASSGT